MSRRNLTDKLFEQAYERIDGLEEQAGELIALMETSMREEIELLDAVLKYLTAPPATTAADDGTNELYDALTRRKTNLEDALLERMETKT